MNGSNKLGMCMSLRSVETLSNLLSLLLYLAHMKTLALYHVNILNHKNNASVIFSGVY